MSDIVQCGFGVTEALPCEPNGRPLDPVARSWWDGGFRCVGYIPPPEQNFKNYLRSIHRALRIQRRKRARRFTTRRSEATE